MKAHSRKTRRRQSRRRARTTPWIVLGAVVATLPSLHASEHRPAALPVDRRIVLEPARLEAALAHVRIWTPSETMPVLRWQTPAAVPAQATAPVYTFGIPAGPLTAAIAEFERVTSVRVTFDATTVRDLTTAGVNGTLTAAQALARLLDGSSLSHRFTDASAAVVEIRVDEARVEVSGAKPRVESTKYQCPARRDAADHPGHSAHAARRAGRDDAHRGAAQRSGHHHAGGRRRRRVEHQRRHVQHARLLGQQQPLRRQRARRRHADPRRLQPRADRSVLRADRLGRGPDATPPATSTCRRKTPQRSRARSGIPVQRLGHRQVRATVDINQPVPLGRRGTFLGNAAIRVNALWQDGGDPRPRRHATRESKSIAPSIAFGLSTPTRATLSGRSCGRTTWPTTGCPRPPHRSAR